MAETRSSGSVSLAIAVMLRRGLRPLRLGTVVMPRRGLQALRLGHFSDVKTRASSSASWPLREWL